MADAPKAPGGPVAAAVITVFGGLGTILDVKHAWVSISDIFRGCQGFFGCTDHLLKLDDTMFNGIMVWLGILLVSVLALIVGMRSLLYHLRKQEVADGTPRIAAKPAKRAASRNNRVKSKPTGRDTAATAAEANDTREDV
ncbi:MAG TPA: hypothetical protein VF631_09915 [Allosphingosinicella sp.]|jgi:hypothetical protein|uniref:hypothetical protein n=1 Tax=Allosphingosinicella sp. TaxID=2823234 RepID=UPI002F2AE080